MTEDPLARLRAQVDAAHEAAQRAAEEIPAAGWAAPGEQARADYDTPEMRALVALVELIRDLVPADVQQQLVELVRELLVLVRALIDLVVARLERRGPAEPEVENIPLT